MKIPISCGYISLFSWGFMAPRCTDLHLRLRKLRERGPGAACADLLQSEGQHLGTHGSVKDG